MGTLKEFRARAARGEVRVGDRLLASSTRARAVVTDLLPLGIVRLRVDGKRLSRHYKLLFPPVGYFTIVGEHLGWDADGDMTRARAPSGIYLSRAGARAVAKRWGCKVVTIVRYLPGCSPRKAG